MLLSVEEQRLRLIALVEKRKRTLSALAGSGRMHPGTETRSKISAALRMYLKALRELEKHHALHPPKDTEPSIRG